MVTAVSALHNGSGQTIPGCISLPNGTYRTAAEEDIEMEVEVEVEVGEVVQTHWRKCYCRQERLATVVLAPALVWDLPILAVVVVLAMEAAEVLVSAASTRIAAYCTNSSPRLIHTFRALTRQETHHRCSHCLDLHWQLP